ncbi:hypothetical protein EI94DRAFT_1835371 [Lactarius quietus]|nr:hypothetical protein EI94DRAFT_1835371 [Lactarius quietus]
MTLPHFSMAPIQENSQEHLQQTIDAEIKSLEEYIQASIQALKESVLMLSAIFSFACLPGIPSLGGKPDNNLARLHISHVCHQWREIALNQSVLWSHVDFNTLSSTGVTEVLVWAKSVPLYLEATRLSWRCWDSFHIRTFNTELQATLRGLVSPAPTLEYLSLSFRGVPTGSNIIPDTLFDCSTPRLSRLELRNCDISWNSPLLKGLKYLEIIAQSESARPGLAVWLDALNEMPQLKVLTLHLASPIAPSPPVPFGAKRAITLPSLTHLYISDSELDCALALAHLDLPTLTWLCLTVTIPNGCNVQGILPYIVRYAHGPQDVLPLQSMVIGSTEGHLNILAWTVPDIDVEMHDPPGFLGATLPPRVALSFKCENWGVSHLEILNMVMAGLPLDGLVMLAAQDVNTSSQLAGDLSTSTQQFWLSHSPKWSLLRRVRLAHSVHQLVLANGRLDADLTRYLCDASMKRVELGFPFGMLDLRISYPDDCNNSAAAQLLSEIMVDVVGLVVGPYDTRDMRHKMLDMWRPLARGPFFEDDSDDKDYDSDDEDNF